MIRALSAGLVLMAGPVSASEKSDPLAGWKSDVRIRPVLGKDAPFHSIHTYFNSNPESPDGTKVLFFRSTDPEAHHGEVCVVDRGSGKVRVLAEGIETEDAHRAACQQWIRGGESVVFHDYHDGEWRVVTVDLESGEKRTFAPGRQVGFCQPDSGIVPLYGSHGAPGEHPDLELLNVVSGEITTAVSVATVRPAWSKTGYADYLDKEFGGKPISICFPMVSPDGKRVFFKLATPGLSRDFRSPQFSRRLGIFSYDLAAGRYLFLHGKWGHPAWHPDSRHFVNMWGNGPVLIDLETGQVEKQMPMPEYLKSGGHPSLSPDGKLFAADGRKAGNRANWAVALGDFKSGEWHQLTEFDNSKGATSWRRNHPHPVFSADGKRIYFNVNSGTWTRLYVAACKTE